nr:M1 family metallopeptidase [Chloroflexota bacterium]
MREGKGLCIISPVLMMKKQWKPLCSFVCFAVLFLASSCQRLSVFVRPTPTPFSTATPVLSPAWLDVDAYRAAMLPTTADDVTLIESPTFYYIRAQVDWVGEEPQVSVFQVTHYTNRTGEPLDRLYFRLWPNKPSYGSMLTFQRVMVQGDEPELEYKADNTAVGVILPHPLQPSQSIEVHMEYQVTVPVGNARGYGTFNYQDGVLLLSNFYAMVAVYEPTGWNLSLAPDYGDPVYAETSFFTMELTVPQGMVVVTSGSTTEKRDNGDGTTTWTCLSGPMRDFMVVASDRFESSSCAVGYIRLNSYYLPEHKEAGEEILEYARNGLRAYQQSFGPYPFAEFDVVEAPIYAGGMEYPGLIMIGQQYYDQGGEYFEFILAHEVAHQWWYSVVGNDQVNVPWLDESLTNFSTVYYYEHAYDRTRADLAFQNFIARRYEQIKGTSQDLPVDQPVFAFDPQEYSLIVYGKGAVFFYELRKALGDGVFLDVLRTYYQDRKYKLATPDDFLRVAEQVSGQELDDFYARWILE